MVIAAPPRGRAMRASLPGMRILVAGLILLATPPSVAGAETPPRITTDSSEYCAELAMRLAAMPAAQEEPARSLAAEGRRLCESGHPRTGVAKLRRAMRAARPEE